MKKDFDNTFGWYEDEQRKRVADEIQNAQIVMEEQTVTARCKNSLGYNILLMEKGKDLPIRLWYMQQTFEHG